MITPRLLYFLLFWLHAQYCLYRVWLWPWWKHWLNAKYCYIWSDYDLDDDIIDCLPKYCYIWYDYDLDDDSIVCLPSIAIYGIIMTWMMTALFAWSVLLYMVWLPFDFDDYNVNFPLVARSFKIFLPITQRLN